MKTKRAAASLAAILAVAGCAGEGPRLQAILNAPNGTVVTRDIRDSFVVIDVDRSTAELVSHYVRTGREQGFFGNAAPGALAIGVGDTVAVTIVSTSETGYLDFANSSVSPISTTPLPPQVVNAAGSLNVPPLGRVPAAGMTLAEFEADLTARLREVLVDPTVIVELVNRESARVTVVGQVGAPGTVSINDTDTRLVDMIAAAGGPTSRPEDLLVRLSRHGRAASITMSDLFDNPRYNIRALPGDILTIQPPDRKLVVLGASGSNRTIRFDEPTVSLADAIAQAGGLVPRRADKRGVFVYRDVAPPLVSAVGVDLPPKFGQMVPTIFRFDLSEPASLFAAGAFEIEDGDILYVSNSLNDEIDAVISAISPFVPTIDEYVRDATLN